MICAPIYFQINFVNPSIEVLVEKGRVRRLEANVISIKISYDKLHDPWAGTIFTVW